MSPFMTVIPANAGIACREGALGNDQAPTFAGVRGERK